MANAVYGLNDDNNGGDHVATGIMEAMQEVFSEVSRFLILVPHAKSIWYPYGKILKDIGKTFKPYQYAGKATQDLLQPVRGLGNLLFGVVKAYEFLIQAFLIPVLIVAAVPFMTLLGVLFGGVVGADNTDSTGLAILVGIAGALLGGVIGFGAGFVIAPIGAVVVAIAAMKTAICGAGYLLRGASQIVTTPLTWLVRMPLRGLITAIKGSPKIEASNKLDRMVTEIETVTNNNVVLQSEMDALFVPSPLTKILRRNVDAIHNKFVRHATAGQDTGISISMEHTHYTQLKEDITSEKLVAYVGQFRAVIEVESEDNATTTAQATAAAAA